LLLLTVNLTGIITLKKLYRKQKLSIFFFHAGFTVLLVGALLTRYFGFEGIMHIKEGAFSDTVYSDKAYLIVDIEQNNKHYKADFLTERKQLTTKPFNYRLQVNNNQSVSFKFKNIAFNVREEIFENQPGGTDMFEFSVTDKGKIFRGLIKEGQNIKHSGIAFSFNQNANDSAISIVKNDSTYSLIAPEPVYVHEQNGKIIDSILPEKPFELFLNQYYSISDKFFYFSRYIYKGITDYIPDNSNSNRPDALWLEIGNNTTVKEIVITGGSRFPASFKNFKINDLNINIAYGNKPVKLPFKIFLDDFI